MGERLLKHALSSGLQIVGQVIPESESVAICFGISAGSRDEIGDVPAGTAHALEHLLFKGTQQYNNLQLLEALTRMGARVNAATCSAMTIYHIQVLREFLEPALALLSEMISAPLLDEDAWETERTVILNELAESEDDPESLLQGLMQQACFKTDTLAHDILGTSEGLAHLSIAQIRRFWQEHYCANRMIISVVGRFNEGHLYTLVERLCGTWKLGMQFKYEKPVVECSQTVSVLYNPRFHLQYLMLGIPAVLAGTPGYRAAILGVRVLWKRLYWAIVQTGLAEDSDVDLWADSRDILDTANLLTLQASCHPSQAQQVLMLMHQELERLLSEGIMEEEIDRVKSWYMNGLVLAYEGRMQRAWELMEQWFLEGRVYGVEEELAMFESITCQDVIDALSWDFVEERLVVTAVGPIEQERLVGRSKNEERTVTIKGKKCNVHRRPKN